MEKRYRLTSDFHLKSGLHIDKGNEFEIEGLDANFEFDGCFIIVELKYLEYEEIKTNPLDEMLNKYKCSNKGLCHNELKADIIKLMRDTVSKAGNGPVYNDTVNMLFNLIHEFEKGE